MSGGFALAGVTVGGGVVSRFDLRVAPGELVALVGPSLTGKTALVEVLAGWVAPEAGTVTWAGAAAPPWSRLAVIPQEIALIEELTVGENVGLALGAAPARRSAPPDDDEVVARLGIGHLWSRGGYEISVGERQRTMVARALVGRPPLVVADEPVAHQDARRAEVVLDLLRERADAGGAVVLATRDPDTAVAADRVLTAPF
ncbi:ATP-binding cassette domain-containing protein [Iamia sp. SCSIO 61187]|uniref:ATP-binding cassette domain-containing protein n=1 Tax=Iamia sp. SCSIO 61187 TaxID=2722752 RepID=UPI001C62ABE0|nr:ATP-binding cassette domain-containing protein [Iamia sp. SCSIO 61187]QYG91214.1 ATP-binding cassette domain-containing protein [Iamia sp. SCSIO 61187]